jgi:transposase-like protein
MVYLQRSLRPELMPKSKARKKVDENFKVAAVQRLQTGGVLANDLAKELGVSIWSLRRWSRQYKRTAAGAGAAREPTVAPEELPAKPSSEPPVAPPVLDGGLIATIARIELEISALDRSSRSRPPFSDRGQ